jgi:hypothetical protein
MPWVSADRPPFLNRGSLKPTNHGVDTHAMKVLDLYPLGLAWPRLSLDGDPLVAAEAPDDDQAADLVTH